MFLFSFFSILIYLTSKFLFHFFDKRVDTLQLSLFFSSHIHSGYT